jgi:CrcB protein
MLNSVLVISAGASMGAVLRWLFNVSLNSLFPAIPPGTLVSNLVGGYLIGICMAFFASNTALAPEWRLFIITGFLGGLTTFSGFSAEVTTLLQQGRISMAGAAIAVHVVGSVTLTLLGIATVAGIRRLV